MTIKKTNMSLYQKPFWLEWKLAPKSLKYHIPVIFHLNGNLLISALESALNAYVNEYHSSLRMYINHGFQEVQQCIKEHLKVDLEFNHFKVDVENEWDPHLKDFIQQLTEIPFDLSQPTLFKFNLIHINENHHVLILNFHHIVADIFSCSYITEVISQLYNHYSYQTEKPSPLEFCYEKYIQTERTLYTIEQEKIDLEYWKKKLQNKPLKLIFDKNNKYQNKALSIDEETIKGDSFFFSLTKDMTSILNKKSEYQRDKMFVLLSTIFSITLSRYFHQKSFILTYPINTRPEDFQKTPGCFVNYAPLLISLTKKMSFQEAIESIFNEYKESQPHSKVPFTHIIHELKKDGLIYQNDVFNVSIIENTMPSQNLQFNEIQASPVSFTKQEKNNDLSLTYYSYNNGDADDTLSFCIDFNIQYFDTDFIKKFSDNFLNILEIFIKTPQQNIFDFPLLIEDSILSTYQKDLKVESNHNINQNILTQKTIDQLIQEQSLKTPHKAAIRYHKKSLSYQELNSLAEILCKRILFALSLKFTQHEHLHKPTIAIMLSRGFELIITMLAVLKAGASYLILNPKEPIKSLQLKLEHPNVLMIISRESDINKNLIKDNGLLYFDLDDKHDYQSLQENAFFDSLQNEPHTSNAKSNHLAYVVFTETLDASKKLNRIEIEHQSIINTLLNFKNILHINEKSSFLTFNPTTTDMYYFELWLPLIAGGLHILTDEKVAESPHLIKKSIYEYSPTFVLGSSLFWTSLIPFLKKNDCHFNILLGKEPISSSLAKKLSSLCTNTWNLYGLSEAAIFVSAYKLKDGAQPILGCSIDNMKMQVLDEYHYPMPCNVAGDLYISGLGLARNQLKESQSDEGHSNEVRSKEVLYNTKTRARVNNEGLIEFLDKPSSLNTTMIEDALNLHPDVLFTVVEHTLYDDEAILVAYYRTRKPKIIDSVFQTRRILTPIVLVEHLKKYLPQWMMPDAFVPIQHIPMNVYGNKELSKFPPILVEHLLVQKKYGKPLDSIELKLYSLWNEILNVSTVFDDFTKIGGNSLDAVFLMTEINAQFNTNFPVSWLIQHNTIKSQAEVLRQKHQAAPTYQAIIPFNAKDKRPALIFIHPAFAGAEVYSEFAEALAPEIPFYVVDSYNLNSQSPFITSLTKLAAQYVDYILSLQKSGPFFLGGWSFGGVFSLEIAHQLTKLGHRVQRLYFLDSKIYSKDYIQYIKSRVSLNNIAREFPEVRSQFLKNLPKYYQDKVLLSYKNDLDLFLHYEMQPYSGKVILIKAEKDKPAFWRLFEDKSNGFKKYLNDLEIIKVKASHVTLIEGEAIKRVAEIINADFLG